MAKSTLAEFIVPLDGLWQKVGYTRKDNAIRSLKSTLVEGVDFISTSEITGGRSIANFYLTEGAAKNFESRSKPLKKDSLEKTVQNQLAKKVNGKTEVLCPVGRIDILTSTEVIEVKEASLWKDAIGQVLVYGSYYPSHIKKICLIGYVRPSMKEIIESHCQKLDIQVVWIGFQTNKRRKLGE